MVNKKNLVNTDGIYYKKLHCASLPNQAKISLKQDYFSVLESSVKVNTTVYEGQIIAEDKARGAAVHSPIPGKVIGFEYVPMPDGKQEYSVIINMEGTFSYLGKKLENTNWNIFTPTQRIQKIADCGIVNTFDIPIPLSEQLYVSRENSVDTLYVRLFDDDPSIYTDGFISDNFFNEVLEGVKIIATTITANNVVLFYPENNKLPEESEINLDKFGTIKVDFIPVKTDLYPCGTAIQLKQIASKKNPQLQESDFFIDASTAYATYQGIVLRTPCIDKILHISGDALRSPQCVKVRIGTPLKSIIAECGGFIEEPEKVIVNGLLKGIAITDFETPITKYVKSLCFVTKRGYPDQKVNDCIRCGRCHDICPLSLHPQKIVIGQYYEGLADCTGCNLCNGVCPSRIPLSQTISLYKGKN